MLESFPDIEVISYEKKKDALNTNDIVVSATSSPHLVIKCDELAGTTDKVLLDLAAPRDIESSAANLPGIRLINLDYLGEIVKKNQLERKHLREESQGIILEIQTAGLPQAAWTRL